MREAFTGHWKQTFGLFLLALSLRLYFALACPHVGGDSPIYEAFARNLLQSGTYSHLELQESTALRPTMIRVPGYPLMLAAIFKIAGIGNETAVRVEQAFLDVFACFLIALIVFEMSSQETARRGRLARLALLLAAVCPFSANYAASILTEVPAILLWTSATLFGFKALKHANPARNWFYCGLLAGGATLFRPESGLLPGIVGFVLILKEGIRGAWKPILVGGSLMAAGLALMLLPWTFRNARSLGTFQPLAPTYAQDQGEMVTEGYFDWCRTWLWSYHDVTRYLFPLETTDLPTDPLPAGAWDNDAQRDKALTLIQQHNEEGDNLDPASDSGFQSLALERRRAHPLRYYLTLPLLRSLAMWFTPRVEILPLEGRLLPLSRAWDEDPFDCSVTLILFLVNMGYITLAFFGAARILRKFRSFESTEFLGCVTLLAIIVIRTGFFACFAFPEPRYVLEAYPAVIALGAFAFPRKTL